MYSQLVIVALAASASANIVLPGHLPIRRDLQNLARQTTAAASTATGTSGTLSDDACQTAILSFADTLPTPDAALESYEATYTASDSCSYSVPASLSSDFDSYTSALYSWYSASSDAFYSVLSECPQYAGEASAMDVCTSAAAGAATSASGSGTSDASATATGSVSGSSATESSTKTSAKSSAKSSSTGSATGSSASASASGSGASAREVGIVGAVLAGVFGAVIAL